MVGPGYSILGPVHGIAGAETTKKWVERTERFGRPFDGKRQVLPSYRILLLKGLNAAVSLTPSKTHG